MPRFDPTRLRDGDPTTVDDDFLYHLYRGGELLQAGDIGQAKDELERAFQLKPRDPKGQSMLGLVYFKLGLLDRALEIYDALVRDNPIDATLHVNLGLVHLKAGRLHQAIKEFSNATDLAPEHKKAQNYLGLAYAQVGDYSRAREAFVAAGSEQMAEKMARAIAGDEPPPSAPPRQPPGANVLPSVAERAQGELEAEEQPFRTIDSDASRPPSSEGWIASGSSETGARTLRLGGARTQTLAEFAEVSRLQPPTAAPFAVFSDGVAIEVTSELFVRLDGVLAVRGTLGLEPMKKRFRGRQTDKPFGEPPRQIHRASGAGQLIVSARPDGPESQRLFTALRLAEEQLYAIEGSLFAFEESLLFENGRVPGKPQDLQLVHLRGVGQLLLATPRPIRTLACHANEPLRVPGARLVGWTGALTPKLVLPHDEAEEPGPAVVELTGEGDVLLAP